MRWVPGESGVSFVMVGGASNIIWYPIGCVDGFTTLLSSPSDGMDIYMQ